MTDSAPTGTTPDYDAMVAAAVSGGQDDPVETPAPETPAEPTPAETPAEPAGSFGVHPSWEAALGQVPEGPARDAIIAQIKLSDQNANNAIANAKGGVSEEWQALIAEAEKNNYAPDMFVEAFNGQLEMVQTMHADPDGFLAELSGAVEQMVAAGQLTRKEGNAVQAQAEEELAVPLTEEQKQLRELQAWKKDQERAAEQQRSQAEEQRVAAEAEAFGDSFMSEFDKQMLATGFTAVVGGVQQHVVPLETLQGIATQAAGILDEAPQTTPAAAIAEATRRLRVQVEAFGGKLPTAPSAPGRPGVPVLGGSAATAPPAPPATPASYTSNERERRMLEAIAAASQQ